MIGLFLPLLLLTPTIWFSLDHKRNVSDGVVSGIGTLFSLDHKLYVSENDSDSVTSENQLLPGHFRVPKTSCENQFHLRESELKIIYIMALHFKPGFETEAWGNSEIAYDQFPSSEKVCTSHVPQIMYTGTSI